MIYFDNSATTKARPEVLDTYRKVSEDFFGNPSSLHALGDHANQMLQTARQQIAQLIRAESDEIYFTSGGTEGDNWVIKGTAMAKKPFGKHLITTSIEHPAVINSMKQLEKLGFDVTYLPVDHRGFVNVDDLKAAIRPDTILVSVMAVNNEVGSMQPIEAIGDLLEDYPTIHFHVDAVQAIGKGIMDALRHPRVDFITFSGHKFHAPRGTGFIYAKRGRLIDPLMTGGGQENDWRSGTENTPAIAAMAKALRLLLTDEQAHVAQQQAVRERIYNHVSQMPNVTMFSQLTPDFAPHILCFAVEGVRGETTVHAFEQHEIYISTTSACSSKKGTESSTLAAMHIKTNVATSAIRVSLDEANTLEEADAFNAAFDQVYADFQKLTATPAAQ
ncbi:cysteine desulfurase family protein [Lacticaseibacillus saniviri]|uniref:Cysteine desulfurase n=1 Tax=Lacticaseibacillus saniviri JCM 17471 = DSM 24301 TaxID=1293598 RepID=A0A0R2N0W2_9LACO|nr:cysteine desulfurase family protein [Lacticaseibacillus saniviri]KRO18402.1 cysteine desulfurase [Lacticaseibacillus saniviri JCM 17471 = DSM 24301]MCG4281411.1 cysteine desulfurase [Lacticaseibacillus saniviri]